jgi:O-antigen biosynthesis protein WbqV
MGLTIARIPRLTDLKSNIEDKKELQQIAIEDLLGRPQAALDRDTIKEFIHKKRILITGAGGTIGSELVRQIASYAPSQVTLLENSEHSLYLIDKELEEKYPQISRAAVIGDVRNKQKLDFTFSKTKPDIVFHAAALKHVPLSEDNIEEAVLTNIIGTKNVADACIGAGVMEMVMISTDKAVNPTSVMGATKRIAEYYAQTLGRSKKTKNTKFITVRFGNVLGSTGSVVPLFKRQLEAGGPLTVTDPNITRYFMTVREAVELVLQASVLGNNGQDEDKGAIYVLDMGDPIPIKDLAYQMIRLAGFKPDEDIKVEYTGLRPGEKMFEELFYKEEEPQKTKHSSIMLAKAKNTDLKRLSKAIDILYKEAMARNTKKTLDIIETLAPEFKPN